jgi:methionine-S-sulfoxide reductase
MSDNLTEQAIFAAGCFWGVQYYFDQVPGVQRTTVGYTGGNTENPTYEEVCTHTTGHAEAVLIEFDPKKINFELLCRHFFLMHDPTQFNKQGPDVGDNYRSEIFYVSERQKEIAQKVLKNYGSTIKKPIVTLIEPAKSFYKAEEYHQKYTERTGLGMCHIPYAPLT